MYRSGGTITVGLVGAAGSRLVYQSDGTNWNAISTF